MTLKEAIASGFKFKRPQHIYWMWEDGAYPFIKYEDNYGFHVYQVSIEDIKEVDWEIKNSTPATVSEPIHSDHVVEILKEISQKLSILIDKPALIKVNSGLSDQDLMYLRNQK